MGYIIHVVLQIPNIEFLPLSNELMEADMYKAIDLRGAVCFQSTRLFIHIQDAVYVHYVLWKLYPLFTPLVQHISRTLTVFHLLCSN